jgi:hypothetical protein
MRVGPAVRIERHNTLGKKLAIIETAGASSSVIYATFGTHHVCVRSTNRFMLWHVARNITPMLTLEPIGTIAIGMFYVDEQQGEFLVGEEDCFERRFDDLRDAVRSLHHTLIKRFIDSRSDLVWIHAGAVTFGGEALLLVAPTGHGKSTLVGELLDWGCSYLSDEVAPIDPISCGVLPFPVSPWKRVNSQDRVPAERLHEVPKVPVELLPTAIRMGRAPLRQIYFLCHDERRETNSIAPCSAAAMVLEMTRNSFTSEDHRAGEIARLCELADRVPAAYLNYAGAPIAARQIIDALAASPSHR